MGKVTIIAAIVFSVIGFILLSNIQLASRETDIQKTDYLAGQMARDLAIKGRQLVLAGWMDARAAGNTTFAPPTSITKDGGQITYNPADLQFNGDIIDFKIRGSFDGAVHEIRSRFQYNDFDTDVIQFKVADMDLSIDPGAVLSGFSSIAIDDQALVDLETTLIDELGLADSLGEFGLGVSTIYDNIYNELNASGNGDIGINIIDSDDRDNLEQSSIEVGGGIYFPDQVVQTVEDYLTSNPGTELTYSSGSSMPSTFGEGSHTVLRIQDNVTIPAGEHVAGSGLLIVEGNLIVEDNASFDWSGIILVLPPVDNLNPQITFTGPTNITGMIVAIQETIPNSGHMDVTAFRDMTGGWVSSYGVDKYQPFWPWWLFHTHDYTSEEGNSVVLFDQNPPGNIHEDHIFMEDTFDNMAPTDSIFFEFFNGGNHGRGIMTFDVTGSPEVVFPVATGFDSTIVDPNNSNRSKVFRVNELQRLHLDITRLSSLKKMWDDAENPFPDCTTWGGINGAICVGETHYRQNAFTLRMYRQILGNPVRVYEVSLYWHRQEVEEEDFENEMQDYVNELTSSDYGLDFTLGDSTIISITDEVIEDITLYGGDIRLGTRNLTNLGTWHQHWEADDPGNPLYVTPSN